MQTSLSYYQSSGRSRSKSESSMPAMSFFFRICPAATQQRKVIMFLLFVAIVLSKTHLVYHYNLVSVKGEYLDSFVPLCRNTTEQGHNYKKDEWDIRFLSISDIGHFCSYIVFLAPAGLCCDRFGAKYFIVAGMMTSSVATFSLGLLKDVEWPLIMLRIFIGAGQAAMYPGSASLIANWIPRYERALFGGIVYGGEMIGIAIGNTIMNVMVTYSGSKMYALMICGGFGFFWSLVLLMYVHSGPTSHPHLARRERKYLSRHIPKMFRKNAPILKILTDLTVWSIAIASVGNYYLTTVLINQQPQFFTSHFGSALLDYTYWWMLPYLGNVVIAVVSGASADFVVKVADVRAVNVRIIYAFSANVITSILVMLTVQMGCQEQIAKHWYNMTIMANSTFYNGAMINILDISINHAGFIMGLVLALGTGMAADAPNFMRRFVVENKQEEWTRLSFYLLLVTSISVIPFAFFAKGARKRWDYRADEIYPPVEMRVTIQGKAKIHNVTINESEMVMQRSQMFAQEPDSSWKTIFSCYKPE